VKAKTIRERLAGTSSEAMYAGYGSNSTGSRYGGTHYKNDSSGSGGNKYAGQGSGSKNTSVTSYSTGSYDEGKSTLDKYKNYTGGSLYSKENLNKEKEKDKKEVKPGPKKEEEVVPKAFQGQVRKLMKPGEVQAPPPPSKQGHNCHYRNDYHKRPQGMIHQLRGLLPLVENAFLIE